MIIIDTALEKLEEQGKPIRVGMVGAGFMASGAALEVIRYKKGMRLVAISNRNIEKTEQVDTISTGHGQETGKENNDHNIIQRGPCKDELGNGFLTAVTLIYEVHHSWDHYCWRYGRHDRPQKGRIQWGHAQQDGGKKEVGQDFKTCWHKGHEEGRSPNFFQILKINAQASLD